MRRSTTIRTPPPERIWDQARAKVEREGRCRVCGAVDVKLEAAHTIGREHDRPRPHPDVLGADGPLWVDPDDVVPLCTAHHQDFDGRRLDLLPYLSIPEQVAAVRHVGIVAALRRLTGARP